MQAGKIDWTIIKTDYINRNARGDSVPRTTLRELSSIWGISYKTLRNRASAEGWNDELRRRTFEHASQVATRLQAEEVISESEVRLRHASTARTLIDKGLARLLQINPESLSPRDAMELVRLGIGEERRALGLADQIQLSNLKPWTPQSSTPQYRTVQEHIAEQAKMKELGRKLLAYVETMEESDAGEE